MAFIRFFTGLFIASLCSGSLLIAQEHAHDHGDHDHEHGAEKPKVEPPVVFLDKNPRIVAYQLKRLSNERLLLVERATDHAKYVPVWNAILLRPGIASLEKLQALDAVVKLYESDSVTQLLTAIGELDEDSREEVRVAKQLTEMLLKLPMEGLTAKVDLLLESTSEDNLLLTSASFAALLKSGNKDVAVKSSESGDEQKIAFLTSVSLLPSKKIRSELRDAVIAAIGEGSSVDVRKAAVVALADVPAQLQANFEAVAPLVKLPELEVASVETLLTVPKKDRSKAVAADLVPWFVKKAQDTPAEKRTEDDFLSAMQLTDELLALIPIEESRKYRQILREITVRVVRVHTVEEEMRYDIPFFVVEAGLPVQVVLINEDLMPHNFVITVPGALQKVAQEGAMLATNPGGLPYVPQTDEVLFATGMVQGETSERLTFNAPTEPGEYPFVCTFPRHWMRMYGTMLVVPDIAVWQQNPVEPADALGNTRTMVANWTMEEFTEDLGLMMRGRTETIGTKLFQEATCKACHKIKGEGGAVGPELTKVFERYKGNSRDVLQEMINPSHKVDPKYAVHNVLLESGKVISGIVIAEDDDTLQIVSNPEDPKPITIQQDEIEEMVRSSKSMMPKGLLDRFTQDEIYEILSLLKNAGG
ncbi:MAG: c-type cytochrome [Pirellulales bacterium]